MKVNIARRYAVFLVFLVLGQEFCTARHAASLRQPFQEKRIEKREAKEESTAIQAKSRQKRVAYAVVLLAVTLTSAAFTFGFEIWLENGGCCKLYPSACSYARKIEELKKSWKTKSKETDDLFLKVQNLREDIIQHSYKLQEMYIDLEAIGNNYKDIVNRVSPNADKNFKIKWKEIQKELNKGNKTVDTWTLKDVDLQFTSYFEDPKTALMGMSTFLTNIFSAVYTVSQAYFRRSYNNKMITKLSTGTSRQMLLAARQGTGKAARVMGLNDAGIKQFVKNTAKARTDAKFGTSSKYMSLYHAYNVIGTLWSLGSDAYRIYRNVKQCEEKRDAVEKIYNEWNKAEQHVTKVKATAQKYYTELNVTWNNVIGNLTDPNLFKTLKNAKQILKTGSTPRLQSASKSIDVYMTSIKSVLKTNSDNAFAIEKGLISGLVKVKFLTKCYVERLKVFGYISDECKHGVGSLTYLYNTAKTIFTVEGNCLDVGVKEVTLDETKTAIAARAKSEKYSADCMLNNKAKQKEVCWDKEGGYSISQIAARRSLTANQVHYLMSICPLPQSVKKRVCILKSFKFSDKDICGFFYMYSRAVLDAVITKCPP